MARCVHQWDVLDKTVLPSGYEQMTCGDRVLEKLKGGTPDVLQAMFQKVVVLTLTCSKCGVLRVERTRLFK